MLCSISYKHMKDITKQLRSSKRTKNYGKDAKHLHCDPANCQCYSLCDQKEREVKFSFLYVLFNLFCLILPLSGYGVPKSEILISLKSFHS